MIKKLLEYLFSLFRKSVKEEVKEEVKAAEKKPRKKYTSHKQERENFSDLLDGIESTFEGYKLPMESASWLNKDSVIGLKKLGAHVPNPFEVKWDLKDELINLEGMTKFPAIMCIGIKSQSNGNKVSPTFMFAIKQTKLPWYAAYHPGIPYEFGMAYPFEGKLFWVRVFLTVSRSTGRIEVCDERRVVSSVIPSKSLHGKHNFGQNAVIKSTKFTTPALYEDQEYTAEDSKIITKNMFRQMFEWWIGRDDRWNVVVKYKGDRLTFGVPNDQTKYYFKDRDKVVTENGFTKKIIHYVKEHERVYSEKTKVIKEHIRGLKEFNWNGYQIQVVSPKLQQKTAAGFTEPGIDADEDKTNVIYLSKLGKMLADFEERKYK